jgi:hypothetical protein
VEKNKVWQGIRKVMAFESGESAEKLEDHVVLSSHPHKL